MLLPLRTSLLAFSRPPLIHTRSHSSDRSKLLGSLDIYSNDEDFSTLPIDLTAGELHHNQELYRLVSAGQFSAAERTRLKLTSNGLYIEPRPEYAKVALGCLRARRLSGAQGQRMEEYETWLGLVPDREQLPPTLPKSNSPFNSIVRELTYREAPSKFLPFLTTTALVVSSKGYARHHFLPLSRLLILNSSPTSPHLDCLTTIEHNAVRYETSHGNPSRSIACEIRCALIELLFNRGWFKNSVSLLMADRPYPIPKRTYEMVLDGIKGTSHSRRAQVILKKWERDSQLANG